MRIAFVGNPRLVHIQRWMGEFESRGHVCRLYAPDGPDLAGTDAVPIGTAGRTGLSSTVVRVLDLRARLRDFRPDVLHAHFALGYGTWAALSGFRPLVVTCMGSDLLLAPKESRLSRLKVGFALWSANLVTVNAGHLGSAAVRLGARAHRVARVVQGVLPSIYTPGDRPDQPPEPVVLSTRHLYWLYRIDDLIRATATLLNRGHRLRLHLAGRGDDEQKLRALARRLGIDRQVDFLGQLDGEQALAAAYQQADIYATVSETDGASVALLEAMSCGLPVVATDIPASREWLTPESGNALVRVGDVEHIAQGIKTLLLSSSQRARAGERNRREVLHRADWTREMDRMEAHYRRLVGD